MARPPAQSRLVDTLVGSNLTKRKLKGVLQTISGECTNDQVCERLGFSKTMLRKLRSRVLYGALAALAPRTPGRPRKPVEDPVKAELRAKVAQLEQALRVERGQTQIALHTTVPGLPRVATAARKKKRPPK